MWNHKQRKQLLKTRPGRLLRSCVRHLTGPSLGKHDIVNWLGKEYGYTTYLEVATRSTGHSFSKIDRERFQVTERLMYHTPGDFDDGLNVDYRTESMDSSALYQQVKESGKRYDIVFVDSLHTYECSIRDFENSIELLSDGGTMVVHDCNPPHESMAQPTNKPGGVESGGWCGVTYAAFIDFVKDRAHLEFCTIDTDFGCGVVRRKTTGNPQASGNDDVKSKQVAELHDAWAVSRSKWDFFSTHRKQLLNLVSVSRFRKLYRKRQ